MLLVNAKALFTDIHQACGKHQPVHCMHLPNVNFVIRQSVNIVPTFPTTNINFFLPDRNAQKCTEKLEGFCPKLWQIANNTTAAAKALPLMLSSPPELLISPAKALTWGTR